MDIDKQNEWNRFIHSVLRVQRDLAIPTIKFKRRLDEDEINHVTSLLKEHYKYAWPKFHIDLYDDHICHCFGFKGYDYY